MHVYRRFPSLFSLSTLLKTCKMNPNNETPKVDNDPLTAPGNEIQEMRLAAFLLSSLPLFQLQLNSLKPFLKPFNNLLVRKTTADSSNL